MAAGASNEGFLFLILTLTTAWCFASPSNSASLSSLQVTWGTRGSRGQIRHLPGLN